MKLIKNILTGVDNRTYDVGRLCILIGVVTFLGLQVYAVVVLKTPWKGDTFGVGFGAIMAGGGAGLWLKKDTEPR